METEIGKYKWLIMAIVCSSQAMTFGLTYSVGVLYKDWTVYLDSTASFLSLVGSAPTAVACIFGPVFGILLDNFNYRKCGLIGGLLMAIGMASCAFVKDATELIVTYGLIAGFGLGLHYYVACTMINEYFVEYRVLAEGVVGGGIGLGNFLFSLLQQVLTNHFTWKGAMLITGGISLHLCINSMFFIPSQHITSHPLNLWRKYDRVEETKKPGNIFTVIEPKSNIPNKDSERRKNFFRRSLLLWKNPLFLMILTSDLLTWLAIFIPYVHLVRRGILEGMDANTASWLSSTFGLASIVGRPVTGFVTNYFHIHPLWAYCTNQIFVGLATFLSSFWSSEAGLFTYAVVFGFLSNGYGFIKASAAKLLAPRWFSDAYSWMLFFEGLGILAGPFLAGYIYDITQSYTWSFRFSGLLLILSASVCFLKTPAKKLQRQIIIKQQQVPLP